MPTNSTIRTKIVVRKLPPSYTSEEFLKYVSPVEEHNYYNFVSGCKSGEQFSRAYFNFMNAEDTTLFKDRYDGYVFLDQKGEEFIAQVEYAPYQKIPLVRTKLDSLAGTIESDGEFVKFVESLKKADETNKQLEGLVESLEASKAKIEAEHEMTPLVDFMRNIEERKQKARDEKRSNRPERASRPPKSKPSRASRKERQREKISERKSKSAAEGLSKTGKSTESKTEKTTETKKSAGDSNEIHVETIINNIKPADSRKEGDPKTYIEDSKSDKSRVKHSYDKQRKSLKQKEEEESSKSLKNSDKGAPTKPIKILKNPVKESSEKAVKEASKADVSAGKTEVKEVKPTVKNENNSAKEDAKGGREESSRASRKEEGEDAKLESAEQAKKPRVRNKDRPERPIYKPGPKRKE